MEAPWPSNQGLKASTLRCGVRILGNTISTGRGLGLGELCRKLEKILGAKSTVRNESHRTLLKVMQSGVNPHKIGEIVGCNIVIA